MKSILIIAFVFAFSSCVLDSNPKLFNVLNGSDTNIAIFISEDSTISDTTLFYGGKYDLNSKKLDELNGVTKKHFFILFFNQDSMYKDIKNKNMYEISRRNYLSRYKLFLDSINKEDTLIYHDRNFTDFRHHIEH